jgi:phosphoenolpyruvate phosphomutase
MRKSIYVDMVADLFHYGHVSYLRQVKEQCDCLIVGVHSDETVQGYKRTPIMTMLERMRVVESCRYVDRVIADAPLHVTTEYLEQNGIEFVACPDNISETNRNLMYGDILDKLLIFKYTNDISTTQIITRLCRIFTNTKADTLKRLINDSSLTYLMEAHSGLSAKIVEKNGFQGIWASGLSISASLGLRDNNEASWTQVLEVVNYMNDASSLPILLDGDTGYGNFNNARRLVKKLDQLGIAGVCIEDKIFPKTNSFIEKAQQLAPISEFCGKIKACVDARGVSQFVIVARTESFIVGLGLEEALERAIAYAEAGADAILVHSKKSTPADIHSFMSVWREAKAKIPVIVVPTTYFTDSEEFESMGVSTVIWANHNMRASTYAMNEVCAQIQKTKSINALERLVTIKDVFELQDEQELAEAEKKYLPLS